MYAVTSMPLVRRTRATFRSAEFGFFGVVVYTRVQTPRRWGEPFNAGVLVFSTLSSRPLRTSWLIVGMGGLDLLPALGCCCLGGACWSCPGAGPDPFPAANHCPAPAVGRVAQPGPGRCSRTGIGRPSRLGAATHRDEPGGGPRRPKRPPRRTANGSRPRAPWARLTTIPVPWRPVKAGSLTCTATGQLSPTGADDTGPNGTSSGSLPGTEHRFPGAPAARPTVPARGPERE